MNLFKKLMTGAAVGALTLAVAGGVGSVSAGATEASDLRVDYAEQTLTVQNAGDEVLVAYPTVKVAKDGTTTVTIKTWDVYATKSGKATVDLSTLNATKETYVAVRDNETATPVVVKFTPVSAKIKAKYDALKGKVTVEGQDEGKATLGYQYRTASGSWTDIDDADALAAKDWSMYTQTGATIYLREKPAAASPLKVVDDAKVGDYDLAVAGSFGGKEVKTKITKSANGPTATANYDTKAFAVKAGVLYRYGTDGEWTSSGAEKTTSAPLPNNKANVFEVKTAATDKKPESKITRYEYAAVKSVTVDKEVSANTDAVTNTTAEGKELTIAYTLDKKENKTGITITNAGDLAYQVVVTDKANATEEDLNKIKATTVKAATAKASGTAKLTSKVVDGKYVYVRYAADKKTGTWASNYACLGKVTLTTAEPEPSPEPSE